MSFKKKDPRYEAVLEKFNKNDEGDDLTIENFLGT
jgi:hypothetical protein